MQNKVHIWSEAVTIPTYGVGKAEKNPMFLEKRVYQGSSGVVYPYPVIEKIADEKEDKVYQAVFLENKYVKIMILPELGGRVQMAFDKIKNRHFIYYNHVIKPALVGLTGPWISGGIEFNWPQHHRPSTFLPVDYTIEEKTNGAKTVWVNEVEVMFRTRVKAGFTLYPDKAYLEIEAHLSNRTLFPQTFLWWANPAVKVNDDYQSIFPPDVHAVFDHGKRDVSSFPIARGVYYKKDYSPGTDISRYKNIPVPTSFMAVNSRYDFMGGYEHDVQAGMLHVANHHTVPGKKQWTWGNADFGQAWDRNLTDSDGPYIELMTGAYTDNQPDFSWLQPNEEKSFIQYFMPYSQIGVVKNANKDLAVHLDAENGELSVGVYATGLYEQARVVLKHHSETYFEKEMDLSPEAVYFEKRSQRGASISLVDLVLEVYDKAGRLLIRYQPDKPEEREIPPPATPAPAPEVVKSAEELYLHGLHLEQYRHATFNPTDYYLEALKRDPEDIRNNNAMGLWFLRRGLFAEAEVHFNKAKNRLLMRNTNPYDSEVLYHLATTLKFVGRTEEAYELFYKAAWSAAWKDVAYLMLARIAIAKGQYQLALTHIEESLIRNAASAQAQHVKLLILRRLGRYDDALIYADQLLAKDAFNYNVYVEKYLLLQALERRGEATAVKQAALDFMRGRTATFIEYALDYTQAQCYAEAVLLFGWLLEEQHVADPLVYYHLAYIGHADGKKEEALRYVEQAALCAPDYCFPNRIEDMLVLEAALVANPKDAKASYYLGNYWYDKRMHQKAIDCWEQSVALDPSFPTAKRNLALAYYNKKRAYTQALRTLEEAFSLDETDARVLMELDQLYKLQQVAPEERLAFLEKHLAQVNERDDLYLERIALFNLLGDYKQAFTLLNQRKFHPWEGGEGKVTGQYIISSLELAKEALLADQPNEALIYLDGLEKYPEHLGEGKLPNAAENDRYYLAGLAYEMLGEEAQSNRCFLQATQGDEEPVQAIFYNDPQPDKIFYQGLAWLKLNQKEKANTVFKKLAAFGEAHLHDTITIDYMAVSLPDLLVFEQDLSEKNHVHCLYLLGLAALGNGDYGKARTYFDQVLQLNNSHAGACIHKNMVSFLKEQAAV